MAQVQNEQVKIGSPAPDFNLPSTNGNNYSLNDFKDSNGIVIVFTCNHCPYAKAAWPLLTKLAEEFTERISFVGINPNDETQYPEDSFDVMKQKVSEWNINFPYLRDEEQKAAKEYGAVCTPDIFVFDKERKLYYHGRINNNWPPVEKVNGNWQTKKPKQDTKEELKNALNNLLQGKSAPKEQNPSMGCSIKWSE